MKKIKRTAPEKSNDGTEPALRANLGDTHSPDVDEDVLAAWNRIKDEASPITLTASRQAKLQRMVLPYPRQMEAMTAFESVRQLGLKTKGEPQLGLYIFEPTGCGKSTTAKQYARLMQREAEPGTKTVLHATIGTTGSAKGLHSAIMGALGDGFANAGNETSLRARTMRMLQSNGVELLILDEAHHAGRSGFRGDITAEVKLMLDMGVVPIVLLGTEEARPIIASSKELAGRLMSPCNLDALDWADEDDRALWIGLLKALDRRMVKDEVISKLIGLDEEELAERLNEVANGIIGQLMRIMVEAVKIATYDERSNIVLSDIAEAVDNWSIEHGFAANNPLWDLIDNFVVAAE